MFTFGFYNSLNGDRKYNAEQMSSIFDGIIEDGVFANVGEAFAVSPGTGLQVVVKTGRAWFKHTWNLNDSWLPIDLEAADVFRSRVDSVVLEVNSNIDVRENTIKIIKGTPAGSGALPPTLIHEDGIDQYCLANIAVGPGATSLRESDITIKVGQGEAPFVTAPVQSVDITFLLDQWRDEFDIWFDNLKAQLSDNVVTNLQNQIDEKLDLSDKATSDDIKNGTPGKWVPSELLSGGIGALGEAGDIVLSAENLEKKTNGAWLKCDQRSVLKSEVGFDLDRPDWGTMAMCPSMNGNPNYQHSVFGSRVSNGRIYSANLGANVIGYTSANVLTDWTSVNINVSDRTYSWWISEPYIFTVDTNSIKRYSMDGVLEKTVSLGSSASAWRVGFLGNRIFLLGLSNSNALYSIYSDDLFGSFHTGDAPTLSYQINTANTANFWRYSIISEMPAPFFRAFEQDSNGNVYTSIISDTKLTILKSTNGAQWTIEKELQLPNYTTYSSGRTPYVFGIVDDTVYFLCSHRPDGTGGVVHHQCQIYSLETGSLSIKNINPIINIKGATGNESSGNSAYIDSFFGFFNNKFYFKVYGFLVLAPPMSTGEAPYLNIGVIDIGMENPELTAIPCGVREGGDTSIKMIIDNGNVYIAARANYTEPGTLKYYDENGYHVIGDTKVLIQVSDRGIEFYPMHEYYSYLFDYPSCEIVDMINTENYIAIYVRMSIQGNSVNGTCCAKIDKRRQLLPMIDNGYIKKGGT